MPLAPGALGSGKVSGRSFNYVVQCAGDISLSTQAQVDAFPGTYGCSEISGTLTISGNDITNLDSLYSVTTIGKLNISSNSNLTNLNGLAGLSRVEACRPDPAGVLL